MAVNFSSTPNVSLLTSLTPTYTTYDHLLNCLDTSIGVYSITVYTMILISSIFPLCIFILYVGHEQWKQQNSSTRMSDSDFFTYHMVIIELINITGFIFCFFAVHLRLEAMLTFSLYLLPISFGGQLFFHILTCVERYLAVVHPITYMGLKKAYGNKIRNTVIIIVWLFCFSGTSLMTILLRTLIFVILFGLLPFALVIILYCSVVVLCVLIRPGPGKVVRERQLMDQSKLKAFYAIVTILAALLMRFGGNIMIAILFLTLQLKEMEQCGVWLSNFIICLPCSLVLPLLFLQRAGKLPCLKGR